MHKFVIERFDFEVCFAPPEAIPPARWATSETLEDSLINIVTKLFPRTKAELRMWIHLPGVPAGCTSSITRGRGTCDDFGVTKVRVELFRVKTPDIKTSNEKGKGICEACVA